MVTGWQKINNTWYYFDGSGAMATNRWVGNYYVGSDGKMAVNTWIGNYYVGADGAWIPGYTEQHQHSYVETVVRKPTCEKAGLKKITCKSCDYEKEESIPATGHSYTESIVTEPTCGTEGLKKFTCDTCGDKLHRGNPYHW